MAFVILRLNHHFYSIGFEEEARQCEHVPALDVYEYPQILSTKKGVVSTLVM